MNYFQFMNKYNSFIGFRLLKTLFCFHIFTDAIRLMERRHTILKQCRWVETRNEIHDVNAVRWRGRFNYDRGYILCIL